MICKYLITIALILCRGMIRDMILHCVLFLHITKCPPEIMLYNTTSCLPKLCILQEASPCMGCDEVAREATQDYIENHVLLENFPCRTLGIVVKKDPSPFSTCEPGPFSLFCLFFESSLRGLVHMMHLYAEYTLGADRSVSGSLSGQLAKFFKAVTAG